MVTSPLTWKRKRKKKGQRRRMDRPRGAELTLTQPSEVDGKVEAQLVLDRIAGGSTLQHEAERLGLLPAAMLAFFRDDDERYAAYQRALADQAELNAQEHMLYSKKLLKEAATLESNEVNSIDKGLKHLTSSLEWNNPSRFAKKSPDQVNMGVPPELVARLADLAEKRKTELVGVPYKDVTEDD
jgi:hypothetical protein